MVIRIDNDAVTAYRTHGVVHLPGVFGPRWLDLAERGIARNMARPGPFFRDQTPPGDGARYVFDYWTWPDIDEFRALILDGPAAAVAARLMGAQTVRLLMDNWFMNEAGATGRAPWHQDEPYFDFEGTMCNVLMFLDDTPTVEGLQFVRGSHRWGKVFKAIHFRDRVPFEGQAAISSDPPDIDADPDAYDVVTFDVARGDALVFDLRTLHRGAAYGRSATAARRRFSLRFGVDGTLFRPRGPWTAETSDHLSQLGQNPGEPLDNPLCPAITPVQ